MKLMMTITLEDYGCHPKTTRFSKNRWSVATFYEKENLMVIDLSDDTPGHHRVSGWILHDLFLSTKFNAREVKNYADVTTSSSIRNAKSTPSLLFNVQGLVIFMYDLFNLLQMLLSLRKRH